jgi:hypothetical protein
MTLTAYSTAPRPNCLPENKPPKLPDTFEEAYAAMLADAKAIKERPKLGRADKPSPKRSKKPKADPKLVKSRSVSRRSVYLTLAYIADHDGATRKEIAAHGGVGYNAVKRATAELVKNKWVTMEARAGRIGGDLFTITPKGKKGLSSLK